MSLIMSFVLFYESKGGWLFDVFLI